MQIEGPTRRGTYVRNRRERRWDLLEEREQKFAAAFLLQGWARRVLYGDAPPYPCRMDVRSLAAALSVMASDTVDAVGDSLQLNEAEAATLREPPT